jgi:hypothetical protein
MVARLSKVLIDASFRARATAKGFGLTAWRGANAHRYTDIAQVSTAGDERTRRPFVALLLALGVALFLCAAPAAEAQQLQGGVQQNVGTPGSGDQFNSQSPDFNAQTPGESFNSQNLHFSASACAEDKARLANKTKLPPGWGPPELISPDELYRHPSEYWAFYKNYDCRPGVALAYRNLNYGKSPPQGWSGFYPPTNACENPGSTVPCSPPYVPPVKGGVNVCDDPNAWRIPQCRQQATPQPGSKGVYRQPAPTAPSPHIAPPTMAILQAMDDCLKNGVPGEEYMRNLKSYYRTPRFQPVANNLPLASYALGTIFYNPEQLDGMADRGMGYTRADILASAFAEHIFVQRKDFYSQVARNQAQLVSERDNIIGFLNRCLWVRKLVPETYNMDPNGPREQFMKLVPGIYADAEERLFSGGWGWGLDNTVFMHGRGRDPAGWDEFLYRNYYYVDLRATHEVYPPAPGGLLVPQ